MKYAISEAFWLPPEPHKYPEENEMRALSLLVMISIGLYAGSALAYVGPGVGAGVVAVVIGVISSVFLAVVGIIWYPIKRLMRRRKEAEAKKQPIEPGGR